MSDIIKQAIRDLEAEQDIRVLFACESGSRAWGFASPDSDYDLRFVYVHPRDWYLELQEKRDVIDKMLPNDLDLSGWDLRKTLRLFATCNLALNEWLGSPVAYWQANGFREELSRLIPEYFNPRKAIHHYSSMARNTKESHLIGESIGIKKLFYILRPLFACHWIEERQTMPPTLFQTMLNAKLANKSVLSAISRVQEQKAKAAEGYEMKIPEVINQWIQESIRHFESTEENFPTGSKSSWDKLNDLMLKWVSLPNGSPTLYGATG